MKGRHLLSLGDFTAEEIHEIFTAAEMLKTQQLAGIPHPILRGRTLAMIFEKPSTRTRVSFEVGIVQLGGYALYLSPKDLQMGRGETVADTARVLSRYVDGIMARVFKHSLLEELAAHSRVPVINGLSDLEHPCQVLTDFFTVKEKLGKLEGLNFVYIGDGANNMAHSLLWGAAKLGVNMRVVTPEGYDPDPAIYEGARKEAEKTGARIETVRDPAEGVAGADVVYTDVWISMGMEDEKEERLRIFRPYQVNAELMRKAPSHCIVMHCLPAHRGEEITDEVIDGPASVVFDQAENRLHVQKAVMSLLIR